MRKRWWTIVRILISLGLLIFVLLTIGLERIGNSLLHAEPGPLLLAFVLFVAGVVVRAVRWRVLLLGLDIQVPLGRLVYIYFVGSFFNIFLPTGFGGDVVRVLELSQQAQTSAALGTVILDRFTGLLVLFAMALVALPFCFDILPAEVSLGFGVLAVGGLIAGALVLQRRLLRRLGDWLPGPLSLTGQGPLTRAFDAITACGWRAVAKALFISLVFNTLLVLINYLAGRAVGIRVSLAYFLVFVPVLSLTLTLPVSIGGLGVREGMAALLFTQIGVDEALAVAFSLAVYAITRLTGLLGGLIYLLHNVRGLGHQAGDETIQPEVDEAES